MFLFHVIISPQGSIIETIKYSYSPPFCVDEHFRNRIGLLIYTIKPPTMLL
jgi:hypothetical protein